MTHASNDPPQRPTPGASAPPWLEGLGHGVRWVVAAGAIGFAVHIVIPAVGDLGSIADAVARASWGWMVVALGASAATYVMAAAGMRWAVDPSTPLRTVVAAQLAAGVALLFAPAGLGGLALNQHFFERRGVPRSTCTAGLMLGTVIAVFVHIAGLVVLGAALGLRLSTSVSAPSPAILLVLLGAVAAVLGLWLLPWTRPLIAPIVTALRAVPALVIDLRRAGRVATAAFLMNLAYVVTLSACVAAFGPGLDIVHAAFVYLFAATIGTVTPTPGGVGGTEVALLAAMTRVGVGGGQAVAAALAFRLVTFWLPMIPGLVAVRWLRTQKLL